MKRFIYILIMLFAMLLVGCTSGADTEAEPVSDTEAGVGEEAEVSEDVDMEEPPEEEAEEGEEESAETDAEVATSGEANTLLAIKVDEVTMDANAAFWTDAPGLTIPTEATTDDRPDGADVLLQAAYDDNFIIVRAEWADSTESVWKNAWTWDGTAFTKSGDEDRILIHFPIGQYAEFASKGCTEACHNTADDAETWYMATSDEAQRLDQWHWKATRTNYIGFADDKWVGIQTDPTDVESAHHGDAKDSGGDTTNVNEAGDGPAFMHGGELTGGFIPAGQEIAIDTSLLSAGDTIPGYILAPLVGSRGDVLAQGVWENGRWVVVLMRALDTGHEDDVVFLPPRPVPFGVSIVDDGGGLKHTNAPDVLILEWEQ